MIDGKTLGRHLPSDGRIVFSFQIWQDPDERQLNARSFVFRLAAGISLGH
jgi:hypothetical protein